jgi:hypothetical protein
VLTRYPELRETPDADPKQRSEWNVRDSDATLVFLPANADSPGTAFTIECAERLGKPLLVVDPRSANVTQAIRFFLAAHSIRTLNIAGPRESESPGIYAAVRAVLSTLFS